MQVKFLQMKSLFFRLFSPLTSAPLWKLFQGNSEAEPTFFNADFLQLEGIRDPRSVRNQSR
jgi:hypothetical protein